MLQLAETAVEQSELAEITEKPASAANVQLGSQPFSVQLEFFSGPMDLLLHLVSQQEVPIEDVKMSVVAEQYLSLVNSQASSLDLEKATEYLVIAATLLAIKSKSLLPTETTEEEQIEDGWVDTRFFEDLKARLREYAVTKQRAQTLIQSPQLGVDTFVRVDRKALLPTPEMMAQPEDVMSLGTVFCRLLKRIGDAGSKLRIVMEPISVVSFMMKIVDSLSDSVENAVESLEGSKSKGLLSIVGGFVSRERLSIRNKESSEPLTDVRGVVIGSFVAILELTKRGLLSVSQGDSQEDIMVGLRMNVNPEELDPIRLESEFDVREEESSVDDNKVVHMSDYRAASHSEVQTPEQSPLEEQSEERKEVGSV